MCVCNSRSDNLKAQLEKKFTMFADYREDYSAVPKMTLYSVVEWFTKAELIDGVRITRSTIKEIFRHLGITSANFYQFESVVQILATSTPLELKVIRRKLINVSSL
jgi:hypothetical protein